MTNAEQLAVVERAAEAGHFRPLGRDPRTWSEIRVEFLSMAEALLGEPMTGTTLEMLKGWADAPLEMEDRAERWAIVRGMIVAWNERLR